VKCEICGEEEAVNECEICGKKICIYCSRFIEKPVGITSVFSSTFYSYATTIPFSATTFIVEMILCKHCCDRLKLSLRIASVGEDEIEEREESIF